MIFVLRFTDINFHIRFTLDSPPPPPQRALVTKFVVPPRAKTAPTVFFYFGARSRNNYCTVSPDRARFVGGAQMPFFRYGRERAAADTLT